MPGWSLSSSSSSAVAGAPVPAFPKDCAPNNPPIGPYDLIDDCNFPSAPDPIVEPTDIPIPIPPVDMGCYELSLTGSFHGPDDSLTGAEGSLVTSVTYPTGDACEPTIDLGIYLPCPVSFSQAFLDVVFDPNLDDTVTSISAIDDGDCDLGISLYIGLPCPTELTAGDAGTVIFDPETETGTIALSIVSLGECDYEINLNAVLPCPTELTGGDGTVIFDPETETGTIAVSIVSLGECDYEINLNATLPCPTELTGGAGGTVDYDPNLTRGTVALRITNLGNCDYQIDLDAALPCPTVLTAQTEVADGLCVPASRKPTLSAEFIDLFASSSTGACDYQLQLSLNIPCPIDWQTPVLALTATQIPASRQPTGDLFLVEDEAAGLSLECIEQPCEPELQLDLDLPCPVIIAGDDPATIAGTPGWAAGRTPTAKIEIGYPTALDCEPSLDLSLDLPCPVSVSGDQGDVTFSDHPYYDPGGRIFAFEQPTVSVVVTEPADCAPLIDISLNLPCPAGALHVADVSGLTDYPVGHPYRTKIPNAGVNFADWTDGGLADEGGLIKGHFSKMEFGPDCNLDLDIDLQIPCYHEEIHTSFFDIGNGNAHLPAWNLFITKQPVDLGSNHCDFTTHYDFYVDPGSGGGNGGPDGRFVEITSYAGTQAPFVYYGYEVAWNDTTEEWDSVSGGLDFGVDPVRPLRNLAEAGPSGAGVRNLVVADIVMAWQASTEQWFCNRMNYRGTYA